ncbi:hypothetical protein BC828DRAFT_377001 [Blastocladiella britannica]|nr:hypothetical protein BC828DRAFT_377001 [Blastocladiella britannica]
MYVLFLICFQLLRVLTFVFLSPLSNVAHNKLIGGIPKTIGKLANLNYISLGGNQLESGAPTPPSQGRGRHSHCSSGSRRNSAHGARKTSAGRAVVGCCRLHD